MRKNAVEAYVIRKYQSHGFRVLTRGWPDLLCFKETANGLEAFGVEIKRRTLKGKRPVRLSRHQILVHRVLEAFGLRVAIESPSELSLGREK